jgi:hypothetical protein
MEDSIKAAAGNAIDKGIILLGVAVIENEIHETCWVRCAFPEDFFRVEKEALAMAKGLIGGIPYKDIDVLLLGEIGKEISGTGYDPNIADRFSFKGKSYSTGARPRYIIVSDLSETTHGNANGIGAADLTTKRAYSKIDFSSTYINCITSRLLYNAKIPEVMPDDETAVRLCMMMCGENAEHIRIVCMKNTMTSMQLYVSPALLKESGNLTLHMGDELTLKNGYFTDY